MSAEAVTRFLERVSADAELQGKVKSAIAERREGAAFEIVEIAGGLGFAFTATELGEHLVEHPREFELSDAELETVAAGLLGNRSKLLNERIKAVEPDGLLVKRRKAEDPDS